MNSDLSKTWEYLASLTPEVRRTMVLGNPGNYDESIVQGVARETALVHLEGMRNTILSQLDTNMQLQVRMMQVHAPSKDHDSITYIELFELGYEEAIKALTDEGDGVISIDVSPRRRDWQPFLRFGEFSQTSIGKKVVGLSIKITHPLCEEGALGAEGYLAQGNSIIHAMIDMGAAFKFRRNEIATKAEIDDPNTEFTPLS